MRVPGGPSHGQEDPAGWPGKGRQLLSVDRGVEEDDVLGVDEPGGAGARHGVAQVRDLSRCGPAGDDGEDPAGPQRSLARRVQRGLARGCAAGRQGAGEDGDRERGLAGRAAGTARLPAWVRDVQRCGGRCGLLPLRAPSQPAPGTATRSPGRENAAMTGTAPAPGHGRSSGPGAGHPGPGTPGQTLSGRPVRPAVTGQGQAPGSGGGALPVTAAAPDPAGQGIESGMRA